MKEKVVLRQYSLQVLEYRSKRCQMQEFFSCPASLRDSSRRLKFNLRFWTFRLYFWDIQRLTNKRYTRHSVHCNNSLRNEGTWTRTLQSNRLSYKIQSIQVGMQPPGHFSAAVFRNRTWTPQFWSFVENVNVRVRIISIFMHATLRTKLLIFHIHTPSGKTKNKRMSYTNKKRENGKLKIQQPSSLTFQS